MYSELLGAFGREAHYRPKRYRPRELLSSLAKPHFRVGDREYPLFDISSNGASLIVPFEIELPVGTDVDAALVVHGVEAQHVFARVVRSEADARGQRIGLSLTHGFLDLEAARRLDASTQLEHALRIGPADGVVPTEFREVITEAVHLVQFYRRSLAPHEAMARAQGEQAICELAARAYERLTPLYRELREKASQAALSFMADPRVLHAAKSYTTTVLTPLLLSAPMIDRSYHKPLGYPGDYQVMLYYYADAFEGETAFAKAFHRLFVQHPLSAGVCTRKDYVVDCMERELARHEQRRTPDSTFAVTSLGCGPALEVSAFIESRKTWQGQIHWRLIDQEPRTLEVAYTGAQRALASVSSRGTVECLNLAFGQLLRSPQLLTRGGEQHFIYSTGLFDYLNTKTSQQLLRALYDCLAPGGEMLIGNAKGPNNYFFCPEFVLDWTLIYRTQEEMRELASVLPGDARVEVDLEPGGAYWFLRIRKGEA